MGKLFTNHTISNQFENELVIGKLCVIIRPTIQIRRRSERVAAALLRGVRRPREGSRREEKARGTVALII